MIKINALNCLLKFKAIWVELKLQINELFNLKLRQEGNIVRMRSRNLCYLVMEWSK